MKKCQNCGAEMDSDALFCRECGTPLTEQQLIHSEKTIPYLDEIIDKHLQYYSNEQGKDVTTNIVTLVNSQMYELSLFSNTDIPLRLQVEFKISSYGEKKKAFDRFKAMHYYPLFATDLTRIKGYSGYIDLAKDVNLAKSILSSLFTDVYKLQKDLKLSYSILSGGKRVDGYDIKDGVHVKREGCFSIIITLIILGTTFLSLM